MPNYDYMCCKCNFVFEEFHKIDDRHTPEKNSCPNCKKSNTVKIKIGSPGIVDPVSLGVRRTDSGFREMMSKIKQNHPRHNMKDR